MVEFSDEFSGGDEVSNEKDVYSNDVSGTGVSGDIGSAIVIEILWRR